MATGGTAVREGFPKKLPSAPKRYQPLGAFLWPQAELRSAKVFKPRLLVQARLGIGRPRQLTRQVEATQVFDTALGRHGATDPPGNPVRHLAPGPQPAVGRWLADHVAQRLQLGRIEQRGGTGIVQAAVAQPREAVVAPQDLAGWCIARDLRHELRRTPLAQKPDDVKVTAFNTVIRSLVAALQLLGRVMRSDQEPA